MTSAGRWPAGRSYTEQFEGRPKDSVRAVAPVQDPDGTVIGLVTAGVDLTTVSARLDRELPWVGAGAAGALLLATLGAGLVSRRLNRQTRGLGPAEVTRMYEHHDAVLHAVREGVLVLDGGGGRLVLANDEAHRLLRLPDHAQGQQIGDLRLEPGIAGLLTSGRSASDEVYAVGDRMLAVNQRPTGSDGGPAGSVATLRDTTELQEVAGQAQVAAQRLELLYTAGLRIGTTLDVVRTAEELTEVAVPRFADAATVDVLEPVIDGQEPLPGPSAPAVRRVALRFEGGAPSRRCNRWTAAPRARPSRYRKGPADAVRATGTAGTPATVVAAGAPEPRKTWPSRSWNRTWPPPPTGAPPIPSAPSACSARASTR